MTATGAQGVAGQQGVTDAGSEYNAVGFVVDQRIGRMAAMMPVKIVAVHGGGLAGIPTVDVQPLVNQIDGNGVSTPHGIIYGIPINRNQGGTNAVINDPKAGDIGHIVPSHRDISSVVANNGQQSNPGSFRRHSMEDSVYHGVMLNGANPKQYLFFTDVGFTIMDLNGFSIVSSADGITITASKINLIGEVHAGGMTGVPVSKQGTVDSGGFVDDANLATNVFVT